MENWSSGEHNKFVKYLGERECTFQAKVWWMLSRPICLLASSRGGILTWNNDCECNKEICPIFQMWKSKDKLRKRAKKSRK